MIDVPRLRLVIAARGGIGPDDKQVRALLQALMTGTGRKYDHVAGLYRKDSASFTAELYMRGAARDWFPRSMVLTEPGTISAVPLAIALVARGIAVVDISSSRNEPILDRGGYEDLPHEAHLTILLVCARNILAGSILLLIVEFVLICVNWF